MPRMAPPLTLASVRSHVRAARDSGKRIEKAHGDTGLYLRASPAGTVRWFAVNRYTRQKHYAPETVVELPDAVSWLKRQEEFKPAADAPETLSDLIVWYTANVAVAKQLKSWATKGRKSAESVFADILNVKLTRLNRAQIQEAVDKRALKAPTAAERGWNNLRAVLNAGAARDYVSRDQYRDVQASIPKAVVARREERKAESVLQAHEVGDFWRATFKYDELWGGDFGAMLRCLMVTGQRLAPVQQMTWDQLTEIDDDWVGWEIPADIMKSSRSHWVPLPHTMVDTWHRKADVPWVFASERGTPITHNMDKQVRRLGSEQVGFRKVTPLDLRRSCYTLGFDSVGINPVSLDLLQGRRLSAARHGVAAASPRYLTGARTRVQEAMSLWWAWVQAAVAESVSSETEEDEA